ncbi:lipopolysaccharide biosynthesis protein [Pelagicoccus sp. SDUM812003]|uniref:lipopolysaccharide biosynthesis protein n=1 Tax=Pelagicoccus sp. SDUM812003 TaxID=3041267 RepID=UPI00280DD465|nr:lipopolysaccharide biosynthesis protein [Pelagicoccus sp. SDUM812003]MDQ8203605.1 lipopolysaccharide biosynthesis protein [Pelagicoccus sp. SDUM812003]
MSLKTKTITGALSTGFGQGVKVVLRLLSIAVLARYLSPEDYGLVALVTSIAGILAIFQEAGLSTAILQKPEVNQIELSSIYWTNVALGFAVFVLTAGFGPIASRIFDQELLVYLLPCYGLAAFIRSFTVQRVTLLQREMKFTELVKADLISLVASTVAAIVAAMNGLGVWSLVVMNLSYTLIYNLMVTVYQKWHPDFRYHHASALPLLRFGASIMGSKLIGRIGESLDAIIVTYFLGVSPAGYYNRAQSILNGPMRQIVNPIISVARAGTFRAADERAKLEKAVGLVLTLTSLVCGSIVLLSFALAYPIVMTLLGPEWALCVPLFMALAPFALIEPCSSYLTTVLVSRGDAAALFKWKLFSVTTIVISLFIGLKWGILGVACSYSLSGLFVRFPLLFAYSSRKIGIPFLRLMSGVLPSLAVGAPLIAINLIAYLRDQEPGLLQSTLLALVTMSVYWGAMCFFENTREAVTLLTNRLFQVMPFKPLRRRMQLAWSRGR